MGEWKITKIEDIATVNMGQSPDSNFVNQFENGMPFLQGNAEFGYRTPAEVFWCTRPRKTAQNEDILVSVRAPVGEVNIADKEYCIGRGLAAVNFWGINKVFASYAFRNVVRQLHNKSQGTTFLAVSKGDIDKAIISYPISAAEQSKIAEILSTVEEAIDKTSALIEKYKNIKAGMMQDLLGVGDEFSLSDLGEIITGKTPKTNIEENYYGGTISFLTPTDDMSVKRIYKTEKHITKRGLSEVRNCLLPANAVCVSCIGSALGQVVITTEQTVTNQQINSIILKSDFNVDFIYYTLCELGKELNKNSKSSTAVPIVNKSEFSRYVVYVPPLPQQQQIAEQLTVADDKIQTECDYLAKLQNIKQGLMQDLLTNTVSVDTLI